MRIYWFIMKLNIFLKKNCCKSVCIDITCYIVTKNNNSTTLSLKMYLQRCEHYCWPNKRSQAIYTRTCPDTQRTGYLYSLGNTCPDTQRTGNIIVQTRIFKVIACSTLRSTIKGREIYYITLPQEYKTHSWSLGCPPDLIPGYASVCWGSLRDSCAFLQLYALLHGLPESGWLKEGCTGFAREFHILGTPCKAQRRRYGRTGFFLQLPFYPIQDPLSSLFK